MSDYSLADIIAAVGGNGGMLNGGGGILVVLILVFCLMFGGRGWNGGGDYGQYATAASQQEILFGQQFSNLDNKMDRGFTSLGNGISDAAFTINNAITGEGRGVQMQLSEGFAKVLDTVRDDGEKTRSLITANEMARIRDERDYYRGRWGTREETDRILNTQGRYYNNPPCRDRCDDCA